MNYLSSCTHLHVVLNLHDVSFSKKHKEDVEEFSAVCESCVIFLLKKVMLYICEEQTTIEVFTDNLHLFLLDKKSFGYEKLKNQ